MMAQSASAPHLLLLAGFEVGANVDQLVEYIQSVFHDNKLLEVWMDPQGEPRAVALFESKLDVQKWQDLCNDKELKNHKVRLSSVKAVSSVFVNTYGKLKAAKDKIGMIFKMKSKGGSKVTDVKQMSFNENCFEIWFEEGWDAVLKASQIKWKLEGVKLKVYPSFDCFKEPVDEQLERLSKSNRSSLNTTVLKETVKDNIKPSEIKSTTAVVKSHKSTSRSLPNQTENSIVDSSYGTQDAGSKAQMPIKAGHIGKDRESMKPDKKKATILASPTLCVLLNLLHFEETVKEICEEVEEVRIDDKEHEIIIKGPKGLVFRLQNMLCDTNKMDLPDCVANFLALEPVQEALETKLQSFKCLLKQTDNCKRIDLYVADSHGKEKTFINFVSSLVVTEKCSHQPHKFFLDNAEWIDFMKQFNDTKGPKKVFTKDESVCLVTLAVFQQEEQEKHIIKEKTSQLTETGIDHNDKTASGVDKYFLENVKTTHNKNSRDGDSETFRMSPLANTDERKEEGAGKKPSTIGSSNSLQMNPEKTKATVYFNRHSFVWLLKVLKLDEALDKIAVKLTDDDTVIIKGLKSNVESLKEALRVLEGKIKDYQNTFLEDDIIQNHLERCLESWHFLVDDEQMMTFDIVSDRGKKMTFEEFVSHWIKEDEFEPPPNIDFQTSDEWAALVTSVHENGLHRIFVTDDKVKLLSPATKSQSGNTANIGKCINDFLKNLRANSVSQRFSRGDTYEDPQGRKEKREVLYYPHERLSYCKQFLSQQITNLESQYKDSSASIKVSHRQVEVTCRSADVMEKIIKELKKLLDLIENEQRSFKFPKLVEFLVPGTGSFLLHEISEKYQCLIDVKKTRSPNEKFSCLERMDGNHSKVPQYNVTMIGSTNNGLFHVHLIQGKMEDVKLGKKGMRVTLRPSPDVTKCRAEMSPSLDIDIKLPQWFCHQEDSYKYFQKLKESLTDSVADVLDKALDQSCTEIALSTEFLKRMDNPFLIDVIAETIIKQLKEKLEVTGYASAKVDKIDLYVCEPTYEPVFKAFKFYLKSVQKPDQACWDKFSPTDNSKFPKLKGTEIGLIWSDRISDSGRILYCYPIMPSLDVNTCPAPEFICTRKNLERTIHQLQRKNTDGLCVSETFPIHNPYGKDVLIYCTQEWEAGAEKAICDAVKNCVEESRGYETLNIVPPGLHSFPMYPVPFLVQKVFNALECTLSDPQSPKPKRINLVVGPKMDDFKAELQRRNSAKTEAEKDKTPEEQKGVLSKIVSVFTSFLPNFEDAEDTGNKPSPTKMQVETVQNSFPDTVLSFWGLGKCTKAADELQRKLELLMNENRTELSLNPNQTHLFEMCMEDVQVEFTFKKHFPVEERDTQSMSCSENKQKKKGKKNKTSKKKSDYAFTKIIVGSTLTMKGLDASTINEIKEMLQGSPSKQGDTSKCLVKKRADSANSEEEEDEDQYSVQDAQNDSASSQEAQRNVSSMETDLHEDSTSSQNMTMTSKQLPVTFRWLYQVNLPNDNIEFQYFEPHIESQIEDAYINEDIMKSLTKGLPFESVNFVFMHVKVKQHEKGIIRTELLEFPTTSNLPESWTQMKNSFAVEKVARKTEEFRRLEDRITDAVKPWHVCITEIKRVQNKALYSRVEAKACDMKEKPQRMWHRIKPEWENQMCSYGFHKLFSAMPRGKLLGDGVTFSKDLKNCLSVSGEDRRHPMYIVDSHVLVGQSGEGRRKLRQPPYDRKNNCQFDSVSKETEYMIFSDAQASPHYVITLALIKC